MILQPHHAHQLETAGQIIIEFNVEDYPLDDEGEFDRFALELVSSDELNRLRSKYNGFIQAGLIEIVREQDHQDHRLIFSFLTEQGQTALSAIKTGFHWDTELNDIAVESMIQKYLDQLPHGVPDKLYDKVSTFTDPRLSKLVQAYVRHRIGATQTNGYWYAK